MSVISNINFPWIVEKRKPTWIEWFRTKMAGLLMGSCCCGDPETVSHCCRTYASKKYPLYLPVPPPVDNLTCCLRSDSKLTITWSSTFNNNSDNFACGSFLQNGSEELLYNNCRFFPLDGSQGRCAQWSSGLLPITGDHGSYRISVFKCGNLAPLIALRARFIPEDPVLITSGSWVAIWSITDVEKIISSTIIGDEWDRPDGRIIMAAIMTPQYRQDLTVPTMTIENLDGSRCNGQDSRALHGPIRPRFFPIMFNTFLVLPDLTDSAQGLIGSDDNLFNWHTLVVNSGRTFTSPQSKSSTDCGKASQLTIGIEVDDIGCCRDTNILCSLGQPSDQEIGVCATSCPSDCSSCPVALNATITGFTGGCGSTMNGLFVLDKSGCSWLDIPPGPQVLDISLQCASNVWTFDFRESSVTIAKGTQLNSGACPPTGVQFDLIGEGTCSGQTGQVILSIP